MGQEETKYLGFVVGQGSIQLVLNKVEALERYNKLKTKKQVRSFLGLAYYY